MATSHEDLLAMIQDVLARTQGMTPQAVQAKKPPKGFKRCRCKVFIPKEWKLCGRCLQWESDDWREGGPARRKTVHAVIVELNR